MATYKDLYERIALDYLNRYDLMAEVKRAITRAISSYETQRLWFNEARTATTTTANQAYFNIPSDFLALDHIELDYAGSSERLIEEPFEVIRKMNAVSAVAVPTHYAYWQDRFELALIPDSAYTVTCYYIKSLPALSADSDSNAWTNEAGNLIAHTATLDVLGNVIDSPNPRKIASHTQGLRAALNELHLRNNVRLTQKLRATSF